MYWINIKANTISVTGSDVIVQDNVNAVKVKLSFSEEWDDLTKTVVFRGSKQVIGIRLTNDLVTIPWECCKTINDMIYVGAYGTNSSNEVVRPTTWAQIGRVVDGVDVYKIASPKPSDTTFADVIEAIVEFKYDLDDMSERVTAIGENLVDVENDLETYSDHTNLYGRDEPDQHPISSIIGLEPKLKTPTYLSPDDVEKLIGGIINE